MSPTRHRILELLVAGPLPVGKLSSELWAGKGLPQKRADLQTCTQIGALKAMGMVERAISGEVSITKRGLSTLNQKSVAA